MPGHYVCALDSSSPSSSMSQSESVMDFAEEGSKLLSGIIIFHYCFSLQPRHYPLKDQKLLQQIAL